MIVHVYRFQRKRNLAIFLEVTMNTDNPEQVSKTTAAGADAVSRTKVET
jgi:hypothetical protein